MAVTPDAFNAWRVFPRILTALYALLMYRVGDWYMALDVPTTEQSAFCMTVVGAAVAWFKYYVESGPVVGPHQGGR